MKKLLSFVLISLCAFCFTACNKQSQNSTSDSQQLMKELLAPRPKLDLNKDYTSDLSGQWTWTAKRVKDQKEIGKGQFIFLQKGRKIIGINQIQTGMESVLPKGVTVKNTANTYLKGTRQEKSPRIQFNINGNGLNIDNNAQLSNKGQSFSGRGFSILSGNGGFQDGKFAEVEYIWEATRTTG